ncbi:uncharacterized protein BT62DRAFT_1078275 [Guyanagaster necrorhizus]|uniref:Uncharacterized protein n=1 Tax=Guyanagaster necrorhizus TaxID=856835 RepID=A0A9P7VM85_9AGAR|nr:uncharacterized protein BT62DRAFT_1078275 [Guyanagaster necrorhizus MCA 3950]KAG7443806.1 hypothetical protein BT62DRAFT_1078275 [Guyanagaster necrorhizus MCA 3950]
MPIGAPDDSSSEMADIQIYIVYFLSSPTRRYSFLILNLSTALSKIASTPLAILVPALWRFLPNGILSIINRRGVGASGTHEYPSGHFEGYSESPSYMLLLESVLHMPNQECL